MNKDGQTLNKDGFYTPNGNTINNDSLGGQITNAAIGGVNLLNSGLNMADQARSIRTKAPRLQYDQFGRPIFNLGQFANATGAIDPAGASWGELGANVMQGASAGSAFGPIGAGIGAGISAISTGLFGNRRKNLMERRKRLAMNSLRTAQRSYNQAMTSFNSQQAARSLYDDTQAMADQRINNVYGALS